MAVPSSHEAVKKLQEVFDSRLEPEQLLREPYLARDTLHIVDVATGDKRWIWSDPPRDVGGYGRADSYRLDSNPDSPLWRPPAEVVSDPRWSEREKETYRQRSVDLTMRGGTTSGVVYPLAVCEIARKRRVRNVGGASAGAIAAAAAAAAELGRSSNLPDEVYDAVTEEERAAGRVRPGFVGLADTISWLCQLPSDKPGQGRDEYRLAQLFRPARQDRRVYAFATAAMRRQLWALPVTALMAFGWMSKILLAAVFLGAVVVTSAVGARLASWPPVGRPAGGSGWFGLPSLGWAALDLGLFFAAVAGVLVFLPGLGKLLPSRSDGSTPHWLTTLSASTSRYRQVDQQRSMAGRVVIAGLLVALPLVLGFVGWWHWTAAILVGTGVSALVAVVVALSVWRYIRRASERRYGLLAGAAPRRSRRSFSELIAGTAYPTVELAVVPWLSDCLSRLAALPAGEVLRFGHLWLGRDFTALPAQPDGDAQEPTWRQTHADWYEQTRVVREACVDPRRRVVNLELITTDLTRQRPYRFPLQPFGSGNPDAEVLYFRLEDLGAVERDGVLVPTDDAMFGIDVIKAMTDSHPVTGLGPDGTELCLHRLPDPWNLPVVFAVRMSMSLPALFKAVRLYRITQPTTVRDDLGRPIADGPKPAGESSTSTGILQWPPKTRPDDPERAEELWFSDGGITSNFPVHLFDAALPAWPTFGLNLGPHPEGFPHQDIWLPQDWQASRAPATELRPPMTALFTSIVDTARSWRDTMQTGMPGSRGRVAWVRQRPDEGGTNLYMPREVIASLALRGALAGARLTRRFDNNTQWMRYRWLRLRTALDNLQALRAALSINQPVYSDLTDGTFLTPLQDVYSYDPYSEKITWYEPGNDSFWKLARQILVDFGDHEMPEPTSSVLSEGVPEPHPTLGQIPPM